MSSVKKVIEMLTFISMILVLNEVETGHIILKRL